MSDNNRKAKVWVLKNKPDGLPKVEDFQCIDEELPHCNEGDIVVEAQYLSVDPYMRYRIRHSSINDVIFGSQVAKVIESKNKDYPVGIYVIGYPGWRNKTLIPRDELQKSGRFSYTAISYIDDHPKSTALGVLGMPGNTAYFGFLRICHPKEGETVLVNGAAGAVGSLVCQIAKIKGCKVIAFAGSDEKISWLKELSLDYVFNYKTCKVGDALKQAAPEGINCYFDNLHFLMSDNNRKAKVWVLKNKPDGLPKVEDFQCIDEELPHCNEGDIVVEAQYLSVDPYMRYRIRHSSINDVIFGSQVAKVIESKNKDYPVGIYVIGYPGWRNKTLIPRDELQKSGRFSYTAISYIDDHPKSTALGVLGMPGNTAYFGFLRICHPKEGETVLVNGAAGAVGSLVCQIAKIKGCKVIAFAGSDEKISWLKELSLDYVFNYKTCKVGDALKQAAPEGINCYFDNVGGQFTAEVLPFMAQFGRISVCGCISTYNDDSKDIGAVNMSSPFNESTVLWKQLKIEGFVVSRWEDCWFEGINQLKEWIAQGKLKYKETLTEGFDKMPEAFIGLFTGHNIGKAIVKA